MIRRTSYSMLGKKSHFSISRFIIQFDKPNRTIFFPFFVSEHHTFISYDVGERVEK